MNLNSLSNIKYNFIGDSIDKLYAYYYYEDLTQKELKHNDNKTFEDLLTEKLADEFSKALESKKIPASIIDDNDFCLIKSEYNYDSNEEQNMIDDLNKLSKIDLSRNKEEKVKIINNICNKHNLEFPAHLVSLFEYEGYYVLISVVKVKGKTKIIRNFYPVKEKSEKILHIREQITDYTKFTSASLSEYMIEIKWMYLYWLPKKPLMHICFIDLDNETDVLYKKMRERNFEESVNSSSRIFSLRTKLRRDSISFGIDAMNNYAFCLININDFIKAIKLFEDIKDKSILSNINLSYIYFCQNNLNDAYKILKKIIRKRSSEGQEAGFLHIDIKHPRLSFKHNIVEDVKIVNVVAWNLALISTQLNEDKSIVNQYLKKVKAIQHENLIDIRVKNWIKYYNNDIKGALENSNKLLDKCNDINYLHNDILEDIDIFQQEVNNE